MSYFIYPCQRIKGKLILPADKSISHRAVILSSIAQGKTIIKNFSFSDDCAATLEAIKALGIKIKQKNKNLIVYGKGLFGFRKPAKTINLKESGTSLRLFIGLLSAQNFSSKLDAKESLRKRPMLRVIQPLRLMDADIKARKVGSEEFAPILINPAKLKSISYKMPVASAQVKSAILLVGLYAKSTTKIYEPLKSRDHTERMLKYFKANITTKAKEICIKPSELISPKEISIPGDISSASFFIVLACLLKKSCIKIKNLGLNPLRSGVIKVLKKMGADIKIIYHKKQFFEPVADVIVKSSKLKGVVIEKDMVPTLIDELPILMVAASKAGGRSVFKGVSELRVKETDRINSMIGNLSRMGVDIEAKVIENKEVIIINGVDKLKGGSFRSFGDHRTAMSMVVAGLLANSKSQIDDVQCISKSFPDFLRTLKKVMV